MRIALTGATGFIGRYIVEQLVSSGHELNCWYREHSDRGHLESFGDSISWLKGNLDDHDSATRLIRDCDMIVHNAYWRPGEGFRGAEGDVVEFARVNILGTLNLIEQSISAGLKRFVFVSTCAVHEQILADRPLDEAHPLWPLSHYGAHKAAIEKFVHSYGFGFGYPICAIRPTGVYGIRNPLSASKWFALVSRIIDGLPVRVSGGGKEVHARDVARGIDVLLNASDVAGQSYACYDQYVSEFEVASVAKELTGSNSEIIGEPKSPKNEIITSKLEELGMTFGGESLLRNTISELIKEALNEKQQAAE